MHLPAQLLILSAVLAAAPGGRERPSTSTSVVVEGTRLTFDPKTCTRGRGMFYWALGSARVTVLGHRKGDCVFDYQWEVEGAGSYTVHRIRVPVTSGPVVIEAGERKGDEAHHWSFIYTSFTRKQATLIRRTGAGGWTEELVEGTGHLVGYRTSRAGEPVRPAPPAGKRVILRFTVYSGGDFKEQAPGARQGQVLRLSSGKGRDWPWARVASAGITPGEVRQVRLPARIAGGARSWLPGERETLFLEMESVRE